jgi:hypothetical protein
MPCRLIASTSASEASGGTKSDPSALCAEMVSYARQTWRSGDRVTATGVLEHGADLIARATEGQPAVAAAAHAAKSRTHLAWAAMQSVRHGVPETVKKLKSDAAYLATPCRFSFLAPRLADLSSKPPLQKQTGSRRARARARHDRGGVRLCGALGFRVRRRPRHRARRRRRRRRAMPPRERDKSSRARPRGRVRDPLGRPGAGGPPGGRRGGGARRGR